ncbi:hypothetical protein Taro_008772 [Colocasia esculenta]|uniref:TFIIS N-terminal domain-containing protein n=1 Tax=Colocasia esculenta TaxID=4460 RepID=A0A843U2U8_COLES|nr:hypothetical protein [Colocasia esculenta]
MSLEDFFTLTEMKDGLTTLARVEELLSVMQNHKDSYSNNLGDATRQWATVANILSATENNDCLNHFVQLNGLLFLNQWLQEAQKGKENSSDCSVEEVINALLGALDKLPVNKEKSSASGIGPTIKQLLCYRNHNIQEKVRILFDKWGHTEDGDSKGQTAEEHGSCCIEETKPSPARGVAEENKQSINLDPKISPSDEEPGDNLKRHSSSSSVDATKVVKHPSNQIPQHVSTSLDANVVSGEIYSYPCQESLCITKESVCAAAEEARTCDSLISRSQGRDSDDESDISSRKDTPDSPKDMEIEVNMEEHILRKSIMEGLCTFSKKEASIRKDDIGTAGDFTELDSDSESKVSKGVDSVISCASMKPTVDANMSEMDGRSEIGLGYGEIDALEVARQVAIEVEREVVDYREPFCSSPEGISQGKSLDSSNSDTMGNSIEKPESEQLNENESPDTNDILEDSDFLRNKEKTLGNVDCKDAHKPESPKSSLVQECVSNANKNKYEFDLNMDVCLEEADCEIVTEPNQNIRLSTPIPVAASKGTPGFPVNRPHFQGGHGWRGSAATSAFRPASPWRTSDGEKTVSGPKQKPKFLRIDLNVPEGEDDVAAYQLEKQTLVSSSIPSRESSMEVSSRRAERLRLDLNRIGDEDTLPNQIPYWRPHLQNPSLSLSPASSSSSRPPSTRDFDLNDNFFDACGSNSQSKSSKERNTYGNYVVEDSVVTIMGSRMPVERRLPVAKTSQPFFVNGLDVDAAINPSRGPVPYPPMPPPPFGYNALVMGPTISIPATFCGPGSIPYIVDSRGATVMPQMLGSAGLGGAPSVRAPFVMNVAGAPVDLNMVGISRPSLDLNSGTNPSEGSFKQFFIQGNSSKMEEQLRPTSQPAGSGMALKRKEPDCGWEPCTFGYKQASPWR